MLETALAQLRFGLSVATGVPFNLRSLDRLVDALGDTQREFGAISPEGRELVAGPELDDQTRREVQLRRFRAQAGRAARETPYYKALFERIGLDPARLTPEDIARIPPTPKEALRDDPDAFVARAARPALRTLTTGTTGEPTSVYFSEYEMRVMTALSAVALIFAREITPDDVVQISTSSRASLGNTVFAGSCARLGAVVYLAGLIEPAHALALLAQERRLPGKRPRASVLSTYPSYLGQLVEEGRRRGYRPADFGLERVFIGGEIVTEGLKRRAAEVFGPLVFIENYALTETAPFGGSLCPQGHLHFEASHGLLEVLDPESGPPALEGGSAASGTAGAPGTIVATPFPPYRDTTLLLRYDTRDVVRPLSGRLTCPMRSLPATTNLLGKRRHCARAEGGWIFPRDVLEALESVEDVALPARCAFGAVPGGAAVEVVARRDDAPARRRIAERLEARLEEQGVPLRELLLVTDPSALRDPLPLRCDLREASYADPAAAAPVPSAAGLFVGAAGD